MSNKNFKHAELCGQIERRGVWLVDVTINIIAGPASFAEPNDEITTTCIPLPRAVFRRIAWCHTKIGRFHHDRRILLSLNLFYEWVALQSLEFRLSAWKNQASSTLTIRCVSLIFHFRILPKSLAGLRSCKS
jgi:hypothetical protein